MLKLFLLINHLRFKTIHKILTLNLHNISLEIAVMECHKRLSYPWLSSEKRPIKDLRDLNYFFSVAAKRSINRLTTSVPHDIETSQLFCFANFFLVLPLTLQGKESSYQLKESTYKMIWDKWFPHLLFNHWCYAYTCSNSFKLQFYAKVL